MTADLRRLVKKLWICSKYPSMYTRQRNHKKRTVYAVRVTFHPCAVLTPWTPCYPVVHVGSDGRNNHSYTILAQSVQRLESYGNLNFPISYTLRSWPLQQLALPCYTVIAILSVRPSVRLSACLSACLVCSCILLERFDLLSEFLHHIIPVFLVLKHRLWNSDGFTPVRWRRIQVRYINFVIFCDIGRVADTTEDADVKVILEGSAVAERKPTPVSHMFLPHEKNYSTVKHYPAVQILFPWYLWLRQQPLPPVSHMFPPPW